MSRKLRECAALKPFYMESEDEFLHLMQCSSKELG
jgi:hypothetical protein